MSAIFGETLTFGQDASATKLVVRGDEHYHRLETLSGYTAVFDSDLDRFCYARLLADHLVSTGVTVDRPAPAELRRHLREPAAIRRHIAQSRRSARLPGPAVMGSSDTMRTFGPNRGLLAGRRLSVGEVKGLTILVDFQDVRAKVGATEVEQMLNGTKFTGHGNACSVREYFATMSSGKLTYTNRVVGPFTLKKNRSYYINTLLVKEALDLAVASGVELSEFDSRHEGIVDAVSILYAGRTQYLGELWPHNAVQECTYGSMRTSLYTLTSLGASAEDLSIGTFCHESGHLLCRFPDLYDYGNRDGDGVESAGMGFYCLMGAGNHLDNGRTPAPVCGYLRELAGWADAIVLNGGGSFEAVHAAYDKIHKFETNKPNEYFIVENRSKIALDAHLPSSGLAVYHCDVLGSNEWQAGTAGKHYQCAMLQADGRLDLELNANGGDGTDLFGAVPGVAVTHASKPSSRLWDGSDSGLMLSGLGAPGPKIAFTVGPVAAGDQVCGEAKHSQAIPDDDPKGIESKIKIARPGRVAAVEIAVDITHPYVGDLEVELRAPSGKAAVLHKRQGGGTENLITTFTWAATPTLAALAGESAEGDWCLHVRDVAGQDVGKLNRWSLSLALEAAEQTLRGENANAMTIPDADPAGIGSSIRLIHPGAVKRLVVALDIVHTYIGDLRIELLSPQGKRVLLHNRLGGGQDDLHARYDSAAPGSPLQPLIGQAVGGAWVLRVSDVLARHKGKLVRWAIEAEAQI